MNIEKSEESVAFIPLEDTEETVTSTGKSSGEDAMDIESVATDTVSTLDTDRHVHFNDSVAPGHTDENRLLAQGDIPCVPSDRLQQKESSRCYVAYVGLPEKMDEWIPLYSVRIQQLNSFSKGRRGEGLDREELIYLANYKIQSSSQAEIDNYAVHRFNSFVEPSIISIVNKFGNAGGFDEIMLQLQRVVGKEITIVPVFPLMTILGKLDRVLTRSFLARYTQNFLNICSNILMNLSLADMRTISIEACIEPSLRALELVATAYYGRNPAMGKYTEPLKLAMGLKVISSPYLNRRLGGIRILNDLLKRVEVGKCTDPIGIKKGKANYDGREIDTYRVFPVLYHYTTHQMCTILKNSSTLVEFFEGSNAHESLVARATNILNVMAMEDCINDQLLSTMLRAGLDDKLNHTLQAVVEVIENVSIYALENVWYLLSKYEKSSALSVGYIDVVGAVAIACRKKLLACNTEEAGYLDFVRSRSTGDADSYHEYTDLESENNVFNYIQTTLNLHRSALMKLWDYAIDNGTVAEAMSARSLSKLEVVIDIGHSFATALQLPFPWTLQWLRLHELVYSAMDALRKATTVTPSLRVIQLFTCSWPIVKADHFVAEVPYLPFGTPRRSDVANYMENSYGIMKLITAAVLQLKKQFNSYCSAIGYSLAGEITSANDLSSATLNGSRISYRTQLEKLTDFLHVFVRCSDSLVIKKEVVESIWNSVVKDSLTMEETDTILSFCTRIIIKILDRRASAEKIDSTESIGPEDKTTSTKRSTVCDRESIKWIFTNLLCNTSFIQSPHFSQKAFECLEKWFRWINGDAGMIMEADNSTASFVVLADPLALIGLNVFPQIIFLCVPDTVVSSAIKFLCSLPHYLKKNLKQTSISANFVNELLLQCIKTLEDIQKDIHQSDVRLNRVLRFLEGLMDETTLKSKHSPPPHGSIGRGNPITFKLSSSSKRLKKSCGDIIMRTNDTVEDLINLVAKQLCVPASDLKIFRRGKEISILEHHKSIHQLKMLSEKESLVVADRPNTSCNNSSTLSVDCGSSLNNRNDIIQSLMDGNSPHVIGQKRGTSDLTDNICSEEESMEVEVANPVAILTSNNDYFELLFSLLCSSAETEADKLWSIITRLPSSTEVFNTWLMLDCTNVSSLLKSRRLNEPINFARLLYSLQIIELLLQPAPSAMELAVQEQYIDADMYRIIVDWPSNFLSLGGFQAICEASTWILNAIDAYIKNDFKQAGITCNSIQLALGLVAKLIKAFLIRICISLEKVHSLKVLLAAISSDVFKSITREGKNLSVLSLLDGKKKSDEEIDWSTVSEMKIEESDDPMTMLKMEDSTAVDFILAEEWGWRIDFSDPFGNDLKGFNLLKLQENALVTMILVAKMGMHTSFGLKSNTVGLAAWKDPARKENVLSLLDDYLCVWAMISLADSTVVAALSSSNGTNSKVTTTYLVRHLLLAEYPKPLSVQEVDTILKDTIATWFSGSIRSMIDLISTFKASVENDADIDGPSDAFKSSILLSLLECKIRINHNTLGEQARDISAAAPLFALTSFIVSKKVNSKQVANSIVTTAVEIIEELTSLDIRSHLIWLDKGVLTGNLMLLHSISQLELEAVQQLLVSKLDFFLSKCLGLVSVENASNPILCLDDSSR